MQIVRTSCEAVRFRNYSQGLHYIFLLLVLGLHDLAGLESPEVLTGSHKPGATRVSFKICIPRNAIQIQKCIFGEVLWVKMHTYCINAIPNKAAH